MLSCLRHRSVCCCAYQDCSVHLCCSCNHVLYIVSVARAVYVCVVSVRCFVFYVCCGDCDTSFFFFRCFVDLVECYLFSQLISLIQCCCDCCCQSCLTVVYVTDCTDIDMRFGSLKFCFCHFCFPPNCITLFFRKADLGVPKSAYWVLLKPKEYFSIVFCSLQVISMVKLRSHIENNISI